MLAGLLGAAVVSSSLSVSAPRSHDNNGFGVGGAMTATEQQQVINASATGEPEVVWAAVDTLHECGIIDVPDIPSRVFWDVAAGVTHMIEGSTSFHRMNGPSPLNVNRSCSVAYNKTADPNPGR